MRAGCLAASALHCAVPCACPAQRIAAIDRHVVRRRGIRRRSDQAGSPNQSGDARHLIPGGATWRHGDMAMSGHRLGPIGTGPEPGEVIVIAGLGRSADWYRNVQAQPAVEVAIARRRFRPVHRFLDYKEAIAVIEQYEQRHRLATPVVRRVLTWLVDWDYDGSANARRRLVQELPLVAFRSDTVP